MKVNVKKIKVRYINVSSSSHDENTLKNRHDLSIPRKLIFDKSYTNNQLRNVSSVIPGRCSVTAVSQACTYNKAKDRAGHILKNKCWDQALSGSKQLKGDVSHTHNTCSHQNLQTVCIQI